MEDKIYEIRFLELGVFLSRRKYQRDMELPTDMGGGVKEILALWSFCFWNVGKNGCFLPVTAEQK